MALVEMSAEHRAAIVTVHEYVDCGLRLQLSANRTLALFRESGGNIRRADFYKLWRSRREQFERANVA